MLRRLMLAALALCAFLALEGCGANHLTAPLANNAATPPVIGNSDPVNEPGGGSDDPIGDPILPRGGHLDGPPRTDDGGDGTISGSSSSGTVIEADSLTVDLEDAK